MSTMDIKDATTKDLSDALSARMTACVFIGYEANPIQTEQTQVFSIFKGAPIVLVGLASIAKDVSERSSRQMFPHLFQI